MENEINVPIDEIYEIFGRMRDSLGDDADARVVECACFILIAECNVRLNVKPTDMVEFGNMARPIILEYMEVFREKEMKEKKFKI